MAGRERDESVADEDRILAAALAGDKTALSELVRRNYERVFRYLVRLGGDYHLAQDLAQETFYRVWQGLCGLRETAPFRPWLYRIAHNVFIDHVRSWHSRNVVAANGLAGEDGEGEADPVVSIVSRRLERSQTAALLGKLSPDHRAVVVLRFYEDLSLGEIAETLELPLGTVKSRLYYAFRELKGILASDGLAGFRESDDGRDG